MRERLASWTTLVVLALATAGCGLSPQGDAREPDADERSSGAKERSRQARTVADMRRIASANALARIETGSYVAALKELEALGLLQEVPETDAWGTAWQYSTGVDSYSLTSFGSDGAAGPPAPENWRGEPYGVDIILDDGVFVQAPTATREGGTGVSAAPIPPRSGASRP